MLHRVTDWFEWFEVSAADRERGEELSRRTAARHDYCHLKDYLALSAVLLHARPERVFEIGTFRGVTSDFVLELLPDCRVVSIAYVRPRWSFLAKDYNNTELTRGEVGDEVAASRRTRFHQLFGDSHKLKADKMVRQFGKFDLVFIDGDHSREGVTQDTELSDALIRAGGAICWHDANPRQMFMETRIYLEQELPRHAIATADDYVGGIACWSRGIEGRLCGKT